MKTKEVLKLDIDDLKTLRSIIDVANGKTDPESFSSVESWVNQCLNKPSQNDLKLMAFNEILDGHGIEGQWSDDYDIGYSFVNLGDMYALTIAFIDGSFVVSSSEDLMIKFEEKVKNDG